MKKLFIVAVISSLIISCKKDTPVTPTSGYNRYSVIGKWSYVYYASRTDTNGIPIAGDTLSFPVGENYYSFTSDSTFIYYVNHSVLSSGNYYIDSANDLLIFPQSSYEDTFHFERNIYGEFWLRTSNTYQYNSNTVATDYYDTKYVKY